MLFAPAIATAAATFQAATGYVVAATAASAAAAAAVLLLLLLFVLPSCGFFDCVFSTPITNFVLAT